METLTVTLLLDMLVFTMLTSLLFNIGTRDVSSGRFTKFSYNYRTSMLSAENKHDKFQCVNLEIQVRLSVSFSYMREMRISV